MYDMKRVLIVEDHEDSRAVAKEVLSLGGYLAIEATDGLAAVEIALRDKPNLILMDLQLPELDGIEAARRIRQAGGSMPIVALTSYALPSDVKAASQAGFTEYLTKP
jgi:two-component system, cell cycle response regulator DivK